MVIRYSRNDHATRRFLQIAAGLYMDWYIAMRYRPGMATPEQAAQFLTMVEWLANNHALLRR